MRRWLGFLGSLLATGAMDGLIYLNELWSFVGTTMIRITSENLHERMAEVQEELVSLLKKQDVVYLDFLSETQHKTAKQNRTFHSLLDCFWSSGCSSFSSKKEMRFHYKELIGLIEVAYYNNKLTDETKQMLWEAVKILPLATGQRSEIVDLLKGKVLKEHSWSEARRERATEAIDTILHDMDYAGVIGSKESKKYQTILEGLNADDWWS